LIPIGCGNIATDNRPQSAAADIDGIARGCVEPMRIVGEGIPAVNRPHSTAADIDGVSGSRCGVSATFICVRSMTTTHRARRSTSNRDGIVICGSDVAFGVTSIHRRGRSSIHGYTIPIGGHGATFFGFGIASINI